MSASAFQAGLLTIPDPEYESAHSPKSHSKISARPRALPRLLVAPCSRRASRFWSDEYRHGEANEDRRAEKGKGRRHRTGEENRQPTPAPLRARCRNESP